ncbi:uncharacterized protein LOC114297673 isoform X3 [Camellia sinensis]|uniref:uncharacterized protein LOC114297673 isoform X3 n=1 Tax=Camellia sinensis TaxID=4442 RepID=UPI001036EA84|nr:uncharacterized protein LOC114297673 isoform X3 [Camellia sinensis]
MASVPRSSWFYYYTNTLSIRPTNTNTNTNIKANPTRNCTFKAIKASSSSSNAESSPPKPKPNSSYSPEKTSQAEPSKTHDPVKLAFAKATAYKKSNPTPNVIIVQNQNPLSLSESDETGITNKLACNEMEKENEKNNEIIAGSSSGIADKSEALFSECAKLDTKNDGSPSEVTSGGNQEVPASVKLGMEKAKEYLKNKGVMGSSKSVEESQTNSGLKGGNALFEKMVAKKEERKISSIDFMGLDFGEKKKSRGLPAGLVPLADSFPERDLRDVEILVGDTSNFGDATVSKPSSTEEDKSDIYKPKISTWGVFPRPSNISKTALKDGDFLMDLGKLKEALPFYEEVMDKLTFQSELHGLAALQWSICQDSLSRPNEARVMYEKLQSHPNVEVSKKAKQFLFAFQAMEMMKMKSTTLSPINTGYQDYFEAFIEDKANHGLKDAEVEESALNQALPYIIFLASPILVVLLIAAVQKGI